MLTGKVRRKNGNVKDKGRKRKIKEKNVNNKIEYIGT
jgi:hypothetical protein